MLPLRYPQRWRLAGLILLLLVLVGAVMPAFWMWPDKGRIVVWIGGVDKWVHCLAFAFLAVWFAGQYRPRSYWRVAIGLLAYGLLIELIQRSISYRSAEWSDVLANVIGILIGLAIATFGMGGWSLRFESWLETRRA